MSLGGLCEDCIYGKHTDHPYNTNMAGREKKVLERVYIDIWRPAQTQSVGGANYFMVIMDGYSSFQTNGSISKLKIS